MQIIHGDNQIASRQLFLSKKVEAQKKGLNIVDLAGADLTLQDLKNSLSSTTLLGESNAVFVEGFFGRRPSNEKKAIAEFIKSDPNTPVIFWDGKDISSQLLSIHQSLITKQDLPKHLFTFIDNWQLTLYHQALKSTDPEPIMALLAKRIHDLILVKEGRGKFPSWQASKLEFQAKKYSLSQLTTYNQQLLDIDYKNKSGDLPYDLAAALELWLLKM